MALNVVASLRVEVELTEGAYLYSSRPCVVHHPTLPIVPTCRDPLSFHEIISAFGADFVQLF